MKILSMETSAKTCSTAVMEEGKVLAYRFSNEGLTHSVSLMPMMDEMLKEANLTVHDMDCFAISNGPGSFTGLRIGVSALKGLAWAEEKPCIGVSTLEAMAQNAKDFHGLIICSMDARRNQIYNALFSADGGKITRETEDRAIGLEELYEEIKNDQRAKIVIGDGASLCYTFLQEKGMECTTIEGDECFQNAVGVAIVAQQNKDAACSSQDLKIHYLRLSQAERERLAKGLPITLDQ